MRVDIENLNMCITNMTITLFSLHPSIILRYLKVWSNRLIELNIQKDHIHLVCSIRPKVSISEYIGLKREDGNQTIQNLSKFKVEILLGQSFFGQEAIL